MENSTDKFDLGDFCKKLRQILGYGYPLKERLADILEGELFEKAVDLKAVSIGEWKSMGFPLNLAIKIREKL